MIKRIAAAFLSVCLTVLLSVCGVSAGETDASSDSTGAQTDSARLLYMGQASIRLTTPEGKTIYIDPYAGDGYGPAADLILVTHDHYDHNNTDLVANRAPDCRIITWKEALEGGTHQTFDLGYATVEAVEAGYNPYHDKAECVGYVITLSDGVSVYVTGDTSTTEQMPLLKEKAIDYAFFCCDGVYNMDLPEAAQCAASVGAKHSIPYHVTAQDGVYFDRDRAEQFDAPGRLIVEAGEEITLNGKDAPQGGPVFDLEKKTVTLNSGYDMPILGLGMFSLTDTEAENSTYWALKAGFRLIDTAKIYGNEAAVGRGLKRAIDEGIVTREEVFLTTKMWTSDYDDGDAAIDASLERLGVDYIDLMILHHSQPANDVDAYQAMERAVSDGKLRSIGLSNYYEPEDFDRLAGQVTITPALLQNETHPYHQSGLMKEHIARYGTVLESWFPLGGRGNTQILFNDETIRGIAEAHGVSSAQVIIRWHLQAGNICIPGSSNEQHIIEDYDVWDFALTDEEMAQMTALERDARFADY